MLYLIALRLDIPPKRTTLHFYNLFLTTIPVNKLNSSRVQANYILALLPVSKSNTHASMFWHVLQVCYLTLSFSIYACIQIICDQVLNNVLVFFLKNINIAFFVNSSKPCILVIIRNNVIGSYSKNSEELVLFW